MSGKRTLTQANGSDAKHNKPHNNSNGSSNGAKKHKRLFAKKRDLDVRARKLKAKEEKQQKRKQLPAAEWIDNASILAMDCEMVGVGLSGKTSVLARYSIVDYEGNVVYDKHMRPVVRKFGVAFDTGMY